MPLPTLSVVVNSCAGFLSIAGERCVASLLAAGVPPARIAVVVGECSETSEARDSRGVLYCRCPLANLDNNAFAYLSCLAPSAARDGLEPWFFYLHDTTYVAADFWERAQDELLKLLDESSLHGIEHVCARIKRPLSMSMGFYKTAWVCDSEEVRACLQPRLNTDLNRKAAVKAALGDLEDLLLNLARERCYSIDNACEVIATGVLMYGTQTPRVVEFYRRPGVYKAKANHDHYGPPARLHTEL